jgi:hypothetical protein
VDAVDVIDDQAHSPPAPELTLSAQLARARLQPGLVEALLQRAPRVIRAFNEDLLERNPLTLHVLAHVRIRFEASDSE